MIIHTGGLPNPAKKMIVDLISRCGSPDEESLSPYDGMRDMLREQHFRTSWSLIIKMLERRQDYNVQAQQPLPGKYVKRTNRNGEYLFRLEDIDESWIRKYIENVLIGLKKDDLGGIREYNQQNSYAPIFLDEDGGFIDSSEVFIEKEKYSPHEVAYAKSKLPYLLKRLYDKSLELGVSVISLMQAYEKAKHINKSTADPKPKAILSVGVLRMDDTGHITGYLPDSANSGRSFPRARAWIRGDNKDAHFYDAIEFMRVCEVLGIDFLSIDPMDFQAEQIAKLTATYLQSSRERSGGPRKYNLGVLHAVSQIGMSEYQIRPPETVSLRDCIRNTVQLISETDSVILNKCLSTDPSPLKWSKFFQAFAAYCPRMKTPISIRDRMQHRHAHRENSNFSVIPLLSDFYTDGGFLCKMGMRGEFQQFPMKHIAPPSLTYETAIAHASGYIFLVTKSDDVYYIDIGRITEYLNTHKIKVSDPKVPSEVCEGWSSC